MKILGDGSLSTLLESVLTFFWIIVWFVVLAFVVTPFLNFDEMHFTFPAKIRQGLVEEKMGPGGTWTLKTTQATVTTPHDQAWIASLVAVPFLGLIAFVLGRLRAIFRSLREGSPFVPANARRLRSVGFAVLSFEALRVVVTSAFIAPALEKLRPAAPGGQVVQASGWPDWTVVFLGLAVLVLAEVFRRGTQMRDEQALTV